MNPIVCDPMIQFGTPTVRGTRINTFVLYAYYRGGMTPSQIAGMYPQITVQQVRAAIRYERTPSKRKKLVCKEAQRQAAEYWKKKLKK